MSPWEVLATPGQWVESSVDAVAALKMGTSSGAPRYPFAFSGTQEPLGEFGFCLHAL